MQVRWARASFSSFGPPKGEYGGDASRTLIDYSLNLVTKLSFFSSFSFPLGHISGQTFECFCFLLFLQNCEQRRTDGQIPSLSFLLLPRQRKKTNPFFFFFFPAFLCDRVWCERGFSFSSSPPLTACVPCVNQFEERKENRSPPSSLENLSLGNICAPPFFPPPSLSSHSGSGQVKGKFSLPPPQNKKKDPSRAFFFPSLVGRVRLEPTTWPFFPSPFFPL